MKTYSHFLVLVLVIASLCFCAGQAQAQFVQTLDTRVTARVQSSTNTIGHVQTEKMKLARLTTKDVLQFLGDATTNDFTGATLVTVDFGDAFQVRRGTNILADVTGFFGQEISADVHDDIFDTFTGKENFHAFWTRLFTFDDGLGNQIKLSGLVDERYTASAAARNGTQQLSDTENFSGAGAGLLGGAPAIYSGSILFASRSVFHP